ncbi:MAG: DUF2779 domain-containing protein, partial [Chlorobi bacterium]|nr:DUF2779 domain-containing protein [Chlorobiota bacterium]
APFNPYKLLSNVSEDSATKKINNGGAAMGAYNSLQFTEVPDSDRNAIIESLLRYCELDTLAMLMIFEHWESLK